MCSYVYDTGILLEVCVSCSTLADMSTRWGEGVLHAVHRLGDLAIEQDLLSLKLTGSKQLPNQQTTGKLINILTIVNGHAVHLH